MVKVRSGQPLWVSALLDKNLTAVEFRVFFYLWWRQGTNGAAWPSQEMIAADLSLTTEAVRKITKRLVSTGWLVVEWPGPGRGPDHLKRYIVACPTKTPTAVGEKTPTAVGVSWGENPNSHTTKTPTAKPRHKEEHIQGTRSVRKRAHFVPPGVDEVRAYADTRGDPDFDAERFVGWYAERGWKHKDGRPVADWKATVRTWIGRDNRRRMERGEPPRDGYSQYGTHPATEDDIERLEKLGVFA